MRTEVLSLGGSLVVQDEINIRFLHEFKQLIKSFKGKRKFVIVVGGGKIARTYINALRGFGKTVYVQAYIGLEVTRLNASLVANFFGSMASQTIPATMRQVKNLLKKNTVVFTGGLKFKDNQTSDGTAASLAKYFKTRFINMTNVEGLYTKDPKKNKNAAFISYISLKEFSAIVARMTYAPGQHFVLDAEAARLIYAYNVPTYIVGGSIPNLRKLLNGQPFIGTTISKHI